MTPKETLKLEYWTLGFIQGILFGLIIYGLLEKYA